MANLSQALLRDTLDAFARLDANKARELIAADKAIDLEFKGVV
jgi:phosphate uptake regulator